MKRGGQDPVEGAMNAVNFLAQQGLPNHGSGVQGFPNGDKRPAADMEGGGFTQFNPQLEIDEADHDDLSDDSDSMSPNAKKSKKTKGRVKIKMEFIENKLRRYTTFSKRKTGIMKKAYELSTLTGTQVMLLVASETGHVYTFATRKLQPMITSESGKALIQTCLNSPDPTTTTAHTNHNPDQRMSATGFEETELTYQVTEEELAKQEGKTPMFTVTNVPGAGVDVSSSGVASTQSGLSITGAGHTYPMTTYLPTGSSGVSTAGNNKTAGITATDMLAQGGFATILPQAGGSLPAGVLQIPQAQSHGSSTASQAIHQPHFLYRLQQPSAPTSPLVLSPTVSATTAATSSSSETVTPSSSSQEPTAVSTSSGAASSSLMYHTSPGIVYATSPGSMAESLFVPSYQATSSASHSHDRGNVSAGLLPASTGQATTNASVPVSVPKPGLESAQTSSHGVERKQTSGIGNSKGNASNRQYLLPPQSKHR